MTSYIINANEIVDRLIEAGNDWADKNAAASLLEETKKSLFSTLAQEYAPLCKHAVEAERKALSDVRYGEHIERMVEARKEADRARVRYDSGRVYADLQRTNAATTRTEMGIR